MRLAEENALYDHMVAVIQRVAGSQVDETNGGVPGIVPLLEDIPTNHILADDSDAAPVPGANLVCHTGFAACTIATNDDQ